MHRRHCHVLFLSFRCAYNIKYTAHYLLAFLKARMEQNSNQNQLPRWIILSYLAFLSVEPLFPRRPALAPSAIPSFPSLCSFTALQKMPPDRSHSCSGLVNLSTEPYAWKAIPTSIRKPDIQVRVTLPIIVYTPSNADT